MRHYLILVLTLMLYALCCLGRDAKRSMFGENDESVFEFDEEMIKLFTPAGETRDQNKLPSEAAAAAEEETVVIER